MKEELIGLTKGGVHDGRVEAAGSRGELTSQTSNRNQKEDWHMAFET